MAFISTRLPERILSGLAIGPRWQSTEIAMDNGNEIINADWLYPKFEATAPMGIYTPADRLVLRNMAMACRGKLHAFRVKDPLDNTATVQPLIEVGGTVYLSKAYTFGDGPTAETSYRPIFAPVTATLTTGTVDLDTGIVTGADPDVDTWSGTFDMWMRFGDDWNAVIAQTKDVWDIQVQLIERWRFA